MILPNSGQVPLFRKRCNGGLAQYDKICTLFFPSTIVMMLSGRGGKGSWAGECFEASPTMLPLSKLVDKIFHPYFALILLLFI